MNTETTRGPLDALAGKTVYQTPAGERGFVVFSGGTLTGFTPVRNADGQSRLALLAADGTEPPITETSYRWIDPADLTPVGRIVRLPGEPNSDVDDEPTPDACGHPDTTEADEPGIPQRACRSCGMSLYLTDEQNTIFRIRDDGAFYVTSVDGTHTFAGPFLNYATADVATEQVETAHGGIVVTDIRFERR